MKSGQPHTLTDGIAPMPTMPSWFLGRTIEVRWTAMRSQSGERPERQALVVALEPVDGEHAILEAWFETSGGRRTIRPRQPVHVESYFDGQLVHVDATSDQTRLLAVSVRPDTAERPVVFAQSALLADAGLEPGAYDPPQGCLISADRGAASA